MSHVIPNSFQTPNIHVDRAMMYLTGDEYKVLNFAVRHIFGWQDKIVKRQGEISLSRFLDGFITEDGTHFGGVGLGRPTLINILKTLVTFGLLVKVGVATANGQTWSIGIAPDWAAMERRHAEMKLKRRDKTAKATVASIVARTTSTSDDTGNVPRTEDGTSHDTGAGTWDDTHINPLLNPPSNPSIASDDAPAVLPTPEKPKRKRKSTAPKPRCEYEQPDVMYETVERVVFEIEGTPDMPYDWKGHCGYITKWLKGEIAKWSIHEFGKISAPALPEHVERFIRWYREERKGTPLPTTPATFVKNWRQWATAIKTQPTPAAKPTTNGKPSGWTAEDDARVERQYAEMNQRLEERKRKLAEGATS